MLNSLSLRFPYGRKLLIVEPGQITRMEAKSNYTCVYFADHPPVLIAKVLKAYDEKLKPFGFIRTHHSHLVNPQYVDMLCDNGTIRMKDASSALISRRKKQAVYRTFSPSVVAV